MVQGVGHLVLAVCAILWVPTVWIQIPPKIRGNLTCEFCILFKYMLKLTYLCNKAKFLLKEIGYEF